MTGSYSGGSQPWADHGAAISTADDGNSYNFGEVISGNRELKLPPLHLTLCALMLACTHALRMAWHSCAQGCLACPGGALHTVQYCAHLHLGYDCLLQDDLLAQDVHLSD